MKRILAALLVAALALPSAGQFPFPVSMYQEAEAGGGGGGPGADGTAFDGSGDYLSHTDETGFTDSKVLTASFWFKRDTSGSKEFFFSAYSAENQRISFLIGSDNKLKVEAKTGVTTPINIAGSTAITDSNWHHVLLSFDVATGRKQIYLDDVAESVSGTTGNFLMDWSTTGTYYVARSIDSFVPVDYDGALSEVWIESDSSMDFTTTSNRRKFIDASGNPEDLGSDGSTPTGTAPEIYLADGKTQTGETASFSENGTPTAVDGPNP